MIMDLNNNFGYDIRLLAQPGEGCSESGDYSRNTGRQAGIHPGWEVIPAQRAIHACTHTHPPTFTQSFIT